MSYVGGVYRLLASGAGREAIARHLASIEGEAMGLEPAPEQTGLAVVDKLLALDVWLSRLRPAAMARAQALLRRQFSRVAAWGTESGKPEEGRLKLLLQIGKSPLIDHSISYAMHLSMFVQRMRQMGCSG